MASAKWGRNEILDVKDSRNNNLKQAEALEYREGITTNEGETENDVRERIKRKA